MSLRVDMNFYNEAGNFMHKQSLFTVSSYLQYESLNAIHKSFFEVFNFGFVLFDENIRYASPAHIPSYMFDVKDGSLLPNKFYKDA